MSFPKEDPHGSSRPPPARRPTDAVDWIVVGVVAIWAAFVFAAGFLGYASQFTWERIWDVFFVGAGWIVLLSIPIRIALPRFRRSVTEPIAISGICFGIGYQDTHLWISIVAWLCVGAILAIKLWQGLERGTSDS